MRVAETTRQGATHVVSCAFLVVRIVLVLAHFTTSSALVFAGEESCIIEASCFELSVTLGRLCLPATVHHVIALLGLQHPLQKLALRQLIVFVLRDAADVVFVHKTRLLLAPLIQLVLQMGVVEPVRERDIQIFEAVLGVAHGSPAWCAHHALSLNLDQLF